MNNGYAKFIERKLGVERGSGFAKEFDRAREDEARAWRYGMRKEKL